MTFVQVLGIPIYRTNLRWGAGGMIRVALALCYHNSVNLLRRMDMPSPFKAWSAQESPMLF